MKSQPHPTCRTAAQFNLRLGCVCDTVLIQCLMNCRTLGRLRTASGCLFVSLQSLPECHVRRTRTFHIASHEIPYYLRANIQ